MRQQLRRDGVQIIQKAIQAVLPDEAVVRALRGRVFSGRVVLVAAGKAAWQMTKAACDCLGNTIERGVIVTKYGHNRGALPNCVCFEGGHPIPDENSFRGTQAALDLVQGLSAEDTVLFLLSGGGSALFELPMIPGEELQDITNQLLASGADIVEINTIRKRLSKVKGGRFAQLCAPARIFSVVLSDVLGDRLDMIASGPACPDPSTCQEAKEIAQRYRLQLSKLAWDCLERETPKGLDHVEIHITGSVSQLCVAAARACSQLGYEPEVLTDQLRCQAREAGCMLAELARKHANTKRSLALIAGGETVVRLNGTGKGGRNQELALAAAEGIEGLENVLVFSVGSDGTDGPTDAAGGMVDGATAANLRGKGIDLQAALANNDSYHALEKVDGLVFTGPTGTNVNDVAVVLVKAVDCE